MRQEELVCVNCPKGCNVTVQLEGDEVKDVQGYCCKEGLNYARQEVIRPMRILTSTVRIEGALSRVIPVITDGEIPLDMWQEAMEKIKTIKVQAPIAVNQIIVADFLGNGCKSCIEQDDEKSLNALDKYRLYEFPIQKFGKLTSNCTVI